MPDVGELQAKLTADVSNFIAGMNVASGAAKTTGASISDSLGRIDVGVFKQGLAASQAFGEAMRGLGSSLNQSTTAAAGFSQAVGVAATSAQTAEQNTSKLGRSAFALASNLGQMAASSDVSASGLARVGFEAARTAAEFQGIPVLEVIGGLAELGTALGVLAVGFSTVTGTISDWQAALEFAEKQMAADEEAAGKVAEALEKIQKAADFDPAAQSLSNFDKQAIAAKQAAFDAAFAADGFSTSLGKLDETMRAIDEGAAAAKIAAQFDQVAAESRKANDEIIATSQKATADLEALQKSLQNVEPASDTIDRLKALRDALDFKGPISDLEGLDTKLQETEAKIRSLAAVKGFDATETEKQVEVARKAIENAFKEDVKKKVEFEADEDSIKKALAKVPKSVTVAVDFSSSQVGGTSQLGTNVPPSVADEINAIRGIQGTTPLIGPGGVLLPPQTLGTPSFTTIPNSTGFGTSDIGATQSGLAQVTQDFANFQAQVEQQNPTVTFDAQMTGSPTLPLTEYLTGYAPKLVSDFAAEASQNKITIGTDVTEKLATIQQSFDKISLAAATDQSSELNSVLSKTAAAASNAVRALDPAQLRDVARSMQVLINQSGTFLALNSLDEFDPIRQQFDQLQTAILGAADLMDELNASSSKAFGTIDQGAKTAAASISTSFSGLTSSTFGRPPATVAPATAATAAPVEDLTKATSDLSAAVERQTAAAPKTTRPPATEDTAKSQLDTLHDQVDALNTVAQEIDSLETLLAQPKPTTPLDRLAELDQFLGLVIDIKSGIDTLKQLLGTGNNLAGQNAQILVALVRALSSGSAGGTLATIQQTAINRATGSRRGIFQ